MGVFRFKQFSVNDDRCSMKVGTDGVLLGAWSEVGTARRILDIGTGSGVIALMLAQRSNADAKIHAIEILPEDAAQAKENVLASPWPEKVSVIHGSAQDYHPIDRYDLITCNPPYFVKSLLPPNPGRSVVRHSGTLPHDELIEAICRLLLPAGNFSLILPSRESNSFREEAARQGLHLRKLTRFFTRSGKPQQRALMTFGLAQGSAGKTQAIIEDSLYLYGHDRRPTEAYVQLTRDFYL